MTHPTPTATHTPGKLHAEEAVCVPGTSPIGRDWIAVVFTADEQRVAQAYGATKEEAEANATLITTAVNAFPALLAACEDGYKDIDDAETWLGNNVVARSEKQNPTVRGDIDALCTRLRAHLKRVRSAIAAARNGGVA